MQEAGRQSESGPVKCMRKMLYESRGRRDACLAGSGKASLGKGFVRDLEGRKEYVAAGLRGLLLFSFSSQEDGGPERLWNLPEITQ